MSVYVLDPNSSDRWALCREAAELVSLALLARWLLF